MNHSSRRPNVSYTLDKARQSIRFTAMTPIVPDEELCIFYGHKLWFPEADSEGALQADGGGAVDPLHNGDSEESTLVTEDHSWTSLPGSQINSLNSDEDSSSDEDAISSGSVPHGYMKPYKSLVRRGRRQQSRSAISSLSSARASQSEGNPNALVPPDQLPLERFKFPDEEEVESDDGPLRTSESSESWLKCSDEAKTPVLVNSPDLGSRRIRHVQNRSDARVRESYGRVSLLHESTH